MLKKPKKSFAAQHPEVAKQWHTEKNTPLTPQDVTPGSKKKVWWKCAQGPDHEWEAAVQNRSKGQGCPFCRGLRVSVTNSLATRCPAVAAEWHPTKNGSLGPTEVTAGSKKIAWWLCAESSEHEWEAAVYSRSNGTGCPYCSGLKVVESDSIATKYPDIAGELHPSRNEEIGFPPAHLRQASERRRSYNEYRTIPYRSVAESSMLGRSPFIVAQYSAEALSANDLALPNGNVFGWAVRFVWRTITQSLVRAFLVIIGEVLSYQMS